MKRILFISATVILLVALLAVPAFAASVPGTDFPNVGSFNYTSYVVSADRDEDYDVCLLNLTSVPLYSELYGTPEGYMGIVTNNTEASFTLPENNSYRVLTGRVFGLTKYTHPGSVNNSTYLQLHNIPSGSAIDLSLQLISSAPLSSATANLTIGYFDAYSNSISSVSFTGSMSEAGRITFGRQTINKPEGAEYLVINFTVNNFTFSGNPGRVTLSFATPRFYLYIDRSYRTNDLLGGISDLVDNIVSGLDSTLQPNVPGGSGDFDVDSDAVIDGSSSGIEYAGSLIDGIGGALAATATGFAALTAIFNMFIAIDFFTLLAQLALTVGLFGVFSGVLVTVASKFRSRGKD